MVWVISIGLESPWGVICLCRHLLMQASLCGHLYAGIFMQASYEGTSLYIHRGLGLTEWGLQRFSVKPTPKTPKGPILSEAAPQVQ